MAGIEDFVEVFRGENLLDKLRSLREINYFKKHNMNYPGLRKIGKFATDKLAHAQDYAGKFPNVIKSAKLSPKTVEFGKNLFDKVHFSQKPLGVSARSRLLLPKQAQKKLKIDILKTIASNAKALTPLALKGLSIVASLPAQVVVMTLAPTDTNADEINMTLEDFAKLAEEAQPKKEKMATGGKAYSTDIKDYYRRAWGLGDRVPFKQGGTWADWKLNYDDQMTFEEYLQDDVIVKTIQAIDKKAKGGRIGLRSGTALASYPLFRGTTGPNRILKAWRGAEMKETLPKVISTGLALEKLPEASFLKKDEDETKDVVERIETIKKEPNQEPPKDPWDPNKLLEVLESTTYNIAENRVKNKAMNYLEKKINERALELGPKIKDYTKRKNILSKEFDKLLGDNVRVARVTKDGQITYVRTQGKRGESNYSKNLIETLNKRNDVTFKREQPFRDQGFVKTNEFKKILTDKGADLTGKGWSVRQFAKTNDIKILDAGSNLGGHWVKLPSEEKLNQLAKQYISVDAKVEKAKELIEEFDLKSWNEITRALNQEGYTRLDNDVLEKYFPELRGQKHTDIDFVPSKTPTAVIQNIRKGKIKTYGNTKLEQLLTTLKNKQGFGEEVHLMHPQQKEKPSKKLYDFSDLMYGSAKENSEYSDGLEAIRNSITNALQTIKFDHEGKDLNKEINIPFSFVNKFGLPKKMTVEKYIDRLNYMLTDLAWLTEGKVRGELLDVWGKKMKFVDNKHGIDWSLVPGKGLLEGQMKKYKGLFEKFKTISGNRIKLDANGAPILKKGNKLTQNQKEILWTIMEGLTEQLVSAEGSQPVSLETVKETFKRIPKAVGGPVLSGVDQYILNRYK